MAYTFKHGDRPLDGLTIQRAVGRGGFGEVYYALTDSGKQVAVKYLRENPEIELRGIAQVMNLKSPHLITIYDVKNNEHGDPFVIMEYVSGPSLRELLIAEPGGLGPQKAAFFITNIAKGLGYLHERGIVHRDMKPGNIFYDDGYVKIGDYGLSKHIAVSAHSGNTVSVGTVHYMAPEIGSGSYSKAIDIYAMGVMLYEMLTGRLPFSGSSMGEVLMRHLNDRPDMAGIVEPFRSVIVKALAKDPKDRYQNVDEMVEALTASGDISDSIAAFDPMSISQTPRSPNANDMTMTSPPRVPPVPPLDARGADYGIPPIPPIPGEKENRRTRRMRRRAERLAERARKAGQRLAGRAGITDIRLREMSAGARARAPHVVTLLLVTCAVSIALGFLAYGGDSDIEPAIPSLIMMMIGAVVGPLLAHFYLIERLWARNGLLDRFTYAAAGLVCAGPGIAIAASEVSEDFGKLGIALVAMLFIFDWTKRIAEGRKRFIHGSSAIWPGILGLAVSGITDADQPSILHFVFAAVCATVSLLIPATAAMWPYRGKVPPLGSAPNPADEAMLRAAERYDRPQPADAEPLRGVKLAGAVSAATRQAAEANQRAAQEPTPSQSTREPIIREEYAQPSFVGRAANAGIGFVAKLFLLAGVIWMTTFNAKFTVVDDDYHTIVVGGGSYAEYVTAKGGDRHAVQNVTIPPIVVFAPLAIGMVLLMIARRSSGTWHFVRGVFGCGLAIAAAVFVLAGPAKDIVPHLFDQDWNALHDAPASNKLAAFLIMVGMSLVMLYWPPKPRKRTVVI